MYWKWRKWNITFKGVSFFETKQCVSVSIIIYLFFLRQECLALLQSQLLTYLRLHCSLSDVLLCLLNVPIRIIDELSCLRHVQQGYGDRA